MTPTFRLALPLAAVLAMAALPAAANPAVPAAKVERLVDAITRMVPLGTILESVAAEDPAWPLGEAVATEGPEKLACVRGELSAAGYRRYQVPRVQAYASQNAARLDADLALLEGGAAEVFGNLALAGAEAERAGREPNPEAVLAKATPEQLNAFMTLFSDASNAGLRQLGGIGEALAVNKTQAEMEEAGEAVGADLATRLMRRALATCDVDPALSP